MMARYVAKIAAEVIHRLKILDKETSYYYRESIDDISFNATDKSDK